MVASSDNEEQSKVALLHDAGRLFDLGCSALRNDSFDEACDCLSKALEIQVQHYGELALECLSTYSKYGYALFYKVQAETDPLVDTAAAKEHKLETSHPDTSVSKEDSEDGQEEDDGEDDNETGEQAGDDGELDDLELAWKMLDIARVIHSKLPCHSLDEIDVITTLADISLEKEDFSTCFDDYERALQTLELIVEPDSRRIAELCFKISLAKQLEIKPQEALRYCKRAVSVCEQRVQRLGRKLTEEVIGNQLEQDISHGEEDSCKMLEKEKSVVGTDLSEAAKSGQGVVLSFESEIKELESLLVDLGEKVVELEQMAAAPSLLKALQAANPAAAATIQEVITFASMGGPSSNGTGSSLTHNGSSIGATSSTEISANGLCDVSPFGVAASATPVTHLGVVGRGVKRAVVTANTENPLVSPDAQLAKRSLDDMMRGGGSGETQVGFDKSVQ